MANLTQILELILSARNNASPAIKSFTSDLDKAKDAAKKIKTEFDSVRTGMDKLNGKFNTLFGLVVGESIVSFAKSVVDANDALQDMSDRTGVGTEQLSLLSEVAKFGDASLESLAKGLNYLNIEAVKSPETFKNMGLEITDASGKLKATEERFMDIADVISGIDDPALRASIAVKSFGKTGLELLPVLKAGREGIKGWIDDVKQLGAVTTEKMTAQAGEFNDNIQRMQIAAKGMLNALTLSVLPTINLVTAAFIEYRKGVVEVDESNKKLGDSFEGVTQHTGLNVLIKVVGFIGDAFQGVSNILSGLISSIYVVGEAFTTVIYRMGGILKAFAKRDIPAMGIAMRDLSLDMKRLQKEQGENLDRIFLGERFSDKVEKAFNKAVGSAAKATAEAQKAKDNIQKISVSAGNLNAKQIGDAVTAINTWGDRAADKAKKALDAHKRIVDETEELSKRLKRNLPTAGSFEKQLARIAKSEDYRSKDLDTQARTEADTARKNGDEKVAQLQKVADAAQTAYEAQANAFTKSALSRAKENVQSEQTFQAERALFNEQAIQSKERQESVLSETAKYETRNATILEMNDIYRKLKVNKEDGLTNEFELERLQKLGNILKDNKESASGVFSAGDFSRYADEIQKMATVASKADADIYKKQADEVINKQNEVLESLQKRLLELRVKIDDQTLIEETDRLAKVIEDKVKSLVIPLKLEPVISEPSTPVDPLSVPGNYINWGKAAKHADGGRVVGPGTSRQDEIPIMVSADEYIQPAHVMRKPGMYQHMEALRAGMDLSRLVRRTKFADGGGIVPRTDGGGGNSWTIDIRTDSGNIKVLPHTTQDQLDRDLRKQNLRKS